MKQISIKVSGMSCAVCASHVKKTLEKEGATDVNVNFATGDVSFQIDEKLERKLPVFFEKIEALGYTVSKDDLPELKEPFYQSLLFRFLFCAAFTIPLLLHMIWPDSALGNPYLQWALATPVYIVGLITFGKPAWRSLLNRMPDMNVLVMLGATAAYIYSIAGLFLHPEHAHGYLFFESSASIITLILLGNYIESRVVKKTSSSIADLIKLQKTIAKKIVAEDGVERIIEIENSQLQLNDEVLINAGDKVPIDGRVTWGEASVNESMLTGESDPVLKRIDNTLIGGTILESGSVKMRVTAVGKNTTLSQIIELVKQAQNEKPVMQKLVDRISTIFVPTVLLIALITFLAWFFAKDAAFSRALMNSISVLVIACPCAMGLATPLALMVGMGRAAKNGILIKGMQALEECTKIKQIVFDKTGTLTSGTPLIDSFFAYDNREAELKSIVVSLEKHSSHPIAKSIQAAWNDVAPLEMQEVNEEKGKGISGVTKEGDEVFVGAYHTVNDERATSEHQLYVTKNKQIIGWIDLREEIRPDAKEVIDWLKEKEITPILISGDTQKKCETVAQELGIDKVYAEQMPQQKLQHLQELMQTAPTAMVGDGINDAPALAKANLGISLSDATQIAMQQADVLLLNTNLKHLPLALGLGKHTFITIKENLFWAFLYNTIAIPIAAFGFLTPTIAAASMALSDVFLLVNSMRLRVKKVV